MLKEFIPYEQALELKELGFDELCLAKYSIDIVGETIPHFRYNNRISQAEALDEGVWFNHNSGKDHIWAAPLYQQAFRWFREKYDLKFHIRQDNWNNWCSVYILIPDEHERVGDYLTYEEAELACLNKLIELAKIKS